MADKIRGSKEERQCFLDLEKFKYKPEKEDKSQKKYSYQSTRPKNPKKEGYERMDKVKDPGKRYELSRDQRDRE